MSTAVLEAPSRCRYELAYIGRCENPVTLHGSDFCGEHDGILCSCGKQAVGQCSEAVSLVCGRPRCDEGWQCHYHRDGGIVW